MADAEWIDNMRKIVLQAVEAGDSCDIVSGTVTKTAPLEIRWGPNAFLAASQLIVPQYLTDHIQTMDIPGMGEVNVSVKNGLEAGDEVLLIQKRGGQRYLVVDRWQKGV